MLGACSIIGNIKVIVIVIFTVNVVTSTTNGAAIVVRRQIINIVVRVCAWMTYVPTGWKDIWNLLQSFVCACCNTTRTVTTTATVRALKTVTRLRMRNGRIFKCCQFLCITKSMFKNVAPSTSTRFRMREGLSFGLNFKYMCKFHRCNQGLRRVVVCGIDSKTRTVQGENRSGQQSAEPEDYYPHGSDENTLLFHLLSFAGNDRAGHKVTCTSAT